MSPANPSPQQIPSAAVKGIALGILALAATVAALVYHFALRSPPSPADPKNPRQVALGTKLYAQYCASCHGSNLEGQSNWRERKPNGHFPAPPHDATGHTWHHPDRVLFGIVKQGAAPPFAPPGYESDMPAFGGTLKDEEIWAVLAYIKSRWPESVRKAQEEINARSKHSGRNTPS